MQLSMRDMPDSDRWASEQFIDLCEKIKTCRYFNSMTSGPHNILSFVDRKASTSPAIDYDEDDFRSFLTLFRKLMADKEPTNIFRVRNLLARYSPPDRPALSEIKRVLKKAEKDQPIGIIEIRPGGVKKSWKPREIVDAIFNGEVFHTDRAKQSDLTRIRNFGPVAQVVFISYALKVVVSAFNVAEILRSRLDAEGASK